MGLVLVLGITLMLSITAMMLAATTVQHESIVSGVALEKLSYRALEAGISDVSYELNSNFDYLSCNSSNTPGSLDAAQPSALPPTAPAVLPLCAKATPFNVWIPVVDTGRSPFVPQYYLISNPQFSLPTYNATTRTYDISGTTATPVTFDILGAAGNSGDVQYQSTTAVFQATNQLLLNAYWTQYNDIDPTLFNVVTGQSPPDCEHLDWQWTASASDEHTNASNYAACSVMINPWTPGNGVHGPLFSDDSVYVEGQPTFSGPVATADPYCQFVDPTSTNFWSKADCNGVNGVTAPTGSQFGRNVEPLPTSNDSLEPIAAADGCVYNGPTAITLNPPNAGGSSTMTVSASSGVSEPTVGALLSQNANQCLPQAPGASVPIPDNGVVYVEDAPPTGPCASEQALPNEMEATDGSSDPPGCRGDAIVRGSLYGDLTIAASNNVVIDGNVTYCQDPGSPGSVASCPAPSAKNPVPTIPGPVAPGTTAAPATSSVLGLIANQYVELNNPFTTVPPANEKCGQGPPPPDCWLGNVYIDAAILALNHSFVAPGLLESGATYTINQVGSVVEKYAESVSLGFGQSNIEYETGYQSEFYWDPRLSVLSPPYFFKSGQNGNAPTWALTSTSVSQARPCSAVALPVPMSGPAQATFACSSAPFPP